MEKIKNKYNVSHETISDLKLYDASLHEWQKKFNLVSDSSLQESWTRHFCDSMQLFDHIPSAAKTLYDLGSGAGFPGMVLAVIAKYKTPYLNLTLVESTKKKTLYLNHVKELTNTKVEIINDRIENLKEKKVDVITSRALASLKDLLDYSYRFTDKNTRLLFLKGQKHSEEIEEAKKTWNFDCEIIPSKESLDGVILSITNLSKRKGEK